MAGLAGTASAQTIPAAGAAADEAPSIRVGMTFFGDYTYVRSPRITDADGNVVTSSAFNVGRSYINVTGNVSRLVAFRITPDIVRAGADSGAVLNGNLTFRVKYAFAQFNLDEWTTGGSWARFGVQQTPWVDFQEGIYRYRFQGTVFSEREGFLSSSDAGASFHYNFPSSYGDVHVGVYNGETYNRAEVNDQKALQVRATVRPFAGRVPALVGLRAHVFYDSDNYVRDAERQRLIAAVTYEHRHVNAGFEYLDTGDRTSASTAARRVDGKGYSIWATPKQAPTGWEALLRYDRFVPDSALDSQRRSRTIVGVAYWFPHQGAVSAAVMLDYDGQAFDNFTPAPPRQQRVAVHALVNF
jgi:hypothetical protein